MIKFGTDGWRARIAEDFTFDNVRLVSAAFVLYLKNSGLDKKGVAVGYDNRFESEDFAQAAAETCARAGIKTFLSKISFAFPCPLLLCKFARVGRRHHDHRQPQPAGVERFQDKRSFRRIGAGGNDQGSGRISVRRARFCAPTIRETTYRVLRPKPEYLKHIASFVDLEKIKKADLRIVLDPMHGSGAGYLKELFVQNEGAQNFACLLEEINGNRDPLFSGVNPEPIPVNLEELTSYMKEVGAQDLALPRGRIAAGIVLDGDADRIGGVDPTGIYISSHNIFSLLLKHLVENRKMTGKIVKTFNISRLVEKQAKKYGLEIDEVPIGFKYIAEKMLKEKVLIGGEESGGLGIYGNIPERDGSICALMLMELMACEKKTLKQILDGIMNDLGYFTYDRIDLHVDREKVMSKLERLKTSEKFAGRKVAKLETLDGIKLNFEDESWILFRASGTEPVLRIYSEGRSEDQVELMLQAGQQLANS